MSNLDKEAEGKKDNAQDTNNQDNEKENTTVNLDEISKYVNQYSEDKKDKKDELRKVKNKKINKYENSIILLLILGLTVIGLSTLPKSKVVEVNQAKFMQVDRALGETATDYPLRVCGAEKAKKLFNNGEINQESYNTILKELASASGYSYQFLDFRTLTRGTIPYLLMDQCRFELLATHIGVGVVDDSSLPSVFYYKGNCDFFYFKNIGGGRFVSKILTNMPKPTRDCSYQGSILIDVNKDGYLDLVSPQLTDKRIITILNDKKGNFDSEPIISYDVEQLNGQLFSLAAGDLTNNGREDIVVANRWHSPGMTEQSISSPVRILRNTGVAPYFKEDTKKSIPQLEDNWTGRSYLSQSEVPHGIWYASYAVAVLDLNHDGWNDIIEIGDGQANHMLWSKENGSVFEDLTYESGIMKSTAGMGVIPINLEGKKEEQIFVSDAASTFTQQCTAGRRCPAWHGNMLYTSNKTKKFGEEASKYNLSNTGWAFGAIFSDISSNGYPQLVVGTGDIASGRADETFQANFDKPYLLTMGEDKKFFDTSYNLLRALKSPVYLNKVFVSDFDGDRKPDIMLWGYESHAPVLLLNRGEGNFSTLTIKGSGEAGKSTHLCTGCIVQVEIKDHLPYTIYNVFTQQNYGVSASYIPLNIGFGKAKEGKVTITFKDGKERRFKIYPNKDYIITE